MKKRVYCQAFVAANLGMLLRLNFSAYFVKRSSQTNPNFTQGGVTLIELLVVLSIIAILALSASGVQNSRLNGHLEGVANGLVFDIHFARSHAIVRNNTVRISFQNTVASQGACYVIHSGSKGTCICKPETTTACTGNSKEIKTVQIAASTGVDMKSNVGQMSMDSARGIVTPAGSISLASSNGKALKQVVNILGRTRTCTLHGQFAGYQAC